MGFAGVRLCKRFLSRSRSYDAENILCKVAPAKPTLRASRSFAWTALDLFDLTTARPSKVCLAQTKAFDVVGVIYF